MAHDERTTPVEGANTHSRTDELRGPVSITVGSSWLTMRTWFARQWARISGNPMQHPLREDVTNGRPVDKAFVEILVAEEEAGNTAGPSFWEKTKAFFKGAWDWLCSLWPTKHSSSELKGDNHPSSEENLEEPRSDMDTNVGQSQAPSYLPQQQTQPGATSGKAKSTLYPEGLVERGGDFEHARPSSRTSQG